MVAVEVVLLLDPHICWNCTLISANVSMMTAIKTFWKKNKKEGLTQSSASRKEKKINSNMIYVSDQLKKTYFSVP